MALLPKNAKELKLYLETFDGDTPVILDLDDNNYNGQWTIGILPRVEEGNTVLVIEPFKEIEDE